MTRELRWKYTCLDTDCGDIFSSPFLMTHRACCKCGGVVDISDRDTPGRSKEDILNNVGTAWERRVTVKATNYLERLSLDDLKSLKTRVERDSLDLTRTLDSYIRDIQPSIVLKVINELIEKRGTISEC